LLIGPFFKYFCADEAEGVPDKNTRGEMLNFWRMFEDLIK